MNFALLQIKKVKLNCAVLIYASMKSTHNQLKIAGQSYHYILQN